MFARMREMPSPASYFAVRGTGQEKGMCVCVCVCVCVCEILQ
jgi:hypothetical protein